MWSAWPKPIHIFLGKTFSLSQFSGKDIVSSQHAPVSSVAESLALLDTSRLRGRRVNVILSCIFCPAVGFEVPVGIERRREQLEIARAWALRESMVKSDDLICEMDARQMGIAAALDAKTRNDLTAWAVSSGVRVVAIAPLWAHATTWTGAGSSDTDGIQVHEPDGVTVIVANGRRAFKTATIRLNIESLEMPARIRQCLVSLGVLPEQLRRIAFHETPGNRIAGCPAPFANHWRVP